jgi:alkanesulfonate monooxygenase SsuD/methylene tetrahydromethanopterin reductase-like flavin-dependent oxidoreductase (luciferase family)
MRVGVQLPEVEREVRWPEVAAIARAAERSGYDSVWLGDHMLYRGDGRPDRGPWDAWTQLAALAAITSRVRLGPLVAATAFHSPGAIARMAASVAEVSGGRFVLGLGAGWNATELRAFGYPAERLIERCAEATAIIAHLLSGERVTLEGRFARLEDAVVLPMPARRIPLMIGSIGPRLLTATLPVVDAWNVWYADHGNTAEGFARRSAEVDRICAEVGRPANRIERSACVLVAIDGGGERPHNAPPVTPERLRQHLRELADAGCDEAILVVDPITERSVERLAEAVR